jgi:hypothetical protein
MTPETSPTSPSPAGVATVSRTYGELPECVRAMVESHVWDNKNPSEQRDWAVAALAEHINPSDEPDETLMCPAEYETATDHFDPAGYNANDCAGCGMPKSQHRKAASSPVPPVSVEPQPSQGERLHAEIMNLPCKPSTSMGHMTEWRDGFVEGHRDARHAAAELALNLSPLPPGTSPTCLRSDGNREGNEVLEADIFVPRSEWPNVVNLYHSGRLEQSVFSNGMRRPAVLAINQTGKKLRAAGYEITKTVGVDSVYWKRAGTPDPTAAMLTAAPVADPPAAEATGEAP